ncbi:MAG: hypothetical protein WD896_00580 [Parcubacteria group bacterium]
MFRLVVVTLIVLVTSGCVAIPVGGPNGAQLYILYQVGVVVSVVNNCAPWLDGEATSGTTFQGLPYGSSTTVPLISAPFGGSYRSMVMTVKGYNEKREYLGSQTREFYVSTYDGSRSTVWVIDRLDLPKGRGGCV